MAVQAQTLSRRLQSRAAEITDLADAFADWADTCGVPARTAKYLGVMLDELIANIVAHAYGGREDGRIEFAAVFDGSSVCVTLRDFGPAFDPTSAAPAETGQDMEERDFGGLGIHFVRRIADRFGYRREGGANEVCFCKSVPPVPPTAPALGPAT